jgi:hypothetical protein
MTNSTKQAIKSVANTSTVSALGHKTMTIFEDEASSGSSSGEFVPKLLEKIIESKPNNKLEKLEKTSSKRNTPMAKKTVMSIEENILEEENEYENPYETDESYQNVSQIKIDADTTTLNNTSLNQSNISDLTPKDKEEKKPINKVVKKFLKREKNSSENIPENLVENLPKQSRREPSENASFSSPRQSKHDEQNRKSKRKAHKRNASLDVAGKKQQQEEYFDLYKTQNASLLYIKQKYKMYLDWLAENSSVENLMNNGNERGSRKRNSNDPQLNWYQYERTHINSNNKNYFKYLESLKNSNNYAQQPLGAKLVSHSSFGHVSTNLMGKNLSNRPITNLSSLNSDYMPQLGDTHEDIYSLSNKSKGVKFDKTNANPFNPKANGNFENRNNLSRKKTMSPTTGHSNDIFYPAITSFLSQLNTSHSSNNSTPLAMFSLQTHPKKPILKSSQSSEYSNSILNQRRGSVLSIGSDQSSGKSSIQSLSNNNTTNGSNSNNKNKASNKKENLKPQINVVENLNLFTDRIGVVKLPPIARCSEDFYAVLHAMEKDRLV